LKESTLLKISFILICSKFSLSVFITFLFCSVTAGVPRNVALNMPSWQVSTRKDKYGIHSANIANDGNRNTRLMSSRAAALCRNLQLIRGGWSTSRNQQTLLECSWPIRTFTVSLQGGPKK